VHVCIGGGPSGCGSGSNTFFLTNNWVGGIPLRDRFSRLFDLAADRGVTVEEMSRRGWEDGGSVGVEEAPFCVGGGAC